MTWLIAIVRNKALDALRSRARRKETELPEAAALEDGESDLPLAGGPSALELLSQASRALQIEGCLGGLDGSYRQSLALAYYQGLSHSEVAAQMHAPLGSVKTWIRHSRPACRRRDWRYERRRAAPSVGAHMKYGESRLVEHLAAAYVLGTLSHGARRRFERLRRDRADVNLAVSQWEERLGQLARSVPAIRPSARVWRTIEARTRPAVPPAGRRQARALGGARRCAVIHAGAGTHHRFGCFHIAGHIGKAAVQGPQAGRHAGVQRTPHGARPCGGFQRQLRKALVAASKTRRASFVGCAVTVCGAFLQPRRSIA